MNTRADLYRVRSLSEYMRDAESRLDADIFDAPVLLHMMTQAEYWAKQSVRTMAMGMPAPRLPLDEPDEGADRWQNPALLVLTVSPQAGSLTPTTISVGRSARADVCLPYPKISKTHAHFSILDDTYHLVDGGSTNGTYVDGERLSPDTPFRLPTRCIIFFGKYETCLMMPDMFRTHLEQALAAEA